MIIGVAIKYGSEVFSLPAPNRHAHVIRSIGGGLRGPSVQGFITDKGKFLNRVEAFMHAKACNQVKPRKFGQYNGDLLFSEDLW